MKVSGPDFFFSAQKAGDLLGMFDPLRIKDIFTYVDEVFKKLPVILLMVQKSG